MPLRHWNDDNSELRVPVLPDSDPTGNFTLAALLKIDSKSTDYCIMCGKDGTATTRWIFGIGGSNKRPGVTVIYAGGSFQYTTGVAGLEIPVDEWCLVAYTRASVGSRTFHVIPLEGDPVHDGGDLVGGMEPPASTMGGHIAFGRSYGSDSFKGIEGVGAIWPFAMTDGQIESLASERSSDYWANNPLGIPGGCWNFDQEDRLDPVGDLTGQHDTITGSIDSTVDNNGIAGTTIVTGQEPVDWDFSFTPPPLDLSTFMSGGAANIDATLSIGGAKSSAAVAPTLFDDVSDVQRTAGMTDYRLIYCQNDEPFDVTVQAAVSQQLEAGRVLAVGAATQAAGVTVPAIVSDTTAPAGVTFETSSNVNLGTIPPGQFKGLWIRRQVNAGTLEDSTNPCAIEFTVNLG